MHSKGTAALRVFLCHASNDKPAVRALYSKLKEDQIHVWFDEEMLLPGQDWDLEIRKAVRSSDVVLICLSNKSVTKEGYVQKEIRIALDVADEKPEGTIFVIPVKLEKCEVPDRIRRWQWLNLYEDAGGLGSAQYQRLLAALDKRSSQLGMSLAIQNDTEPTASKFELKELAISPPREWLLPEQRSVLNASSSYSPGVNEGELERGAQLIEQTLAALNLPAQVTHVYVGPRFIRFGVEPTSRQTQDGRIRVRISEFESIADDLAASLGLGDIIIQAPVPGKAPIGIDVMKRQATMVSLAELLDGDDVIKSNPFSAILGRDIVGDPVAVDLRKSPNMLIAGRPFSGKSTFVDSLISWLMIRNSPNDLQLAFIDKRRVEYATYLDSPHVVSPTLATNPEIFGVVNWLLREAEDRQRLFSKVGVRTIGEYNQVSDFNEKIPFLLLVIGELLDLTSEDPDWQKVEFMLVRLMGLAGISGIHVLACTAHPSSVMITPRLKAPIANRIALAMSSKEDSKVVIDQPGAEKLLGQGDLLYTNMLDAKPMRIQAPFVSQEEISRIIDFWRQQIT